MRVVLAKRQWIGWVLGLIPAGVLLYAAFYKALDPGLFADQITAHKVSPAAWSAFLAYAFVVAELLLGFALVLRIHPRWSHGAFVAMMVGFIVVTGIAWANGNAKECGCFGRAVSRGPLHVILQDSALIVVSVISLLLLRTARTPRRNVMAGIAIAPLLIAFALLGGRLPAQAVATGIRPGYDFSDVAIEDLRASPEIGWHLLAFVDAPCRGCEAGVPALNEVARARRDLHVAAVVPGSRQEAVAWRMKHLPGFPVVHGAARALRAYYRELPTAFLLQDGRVRHVWWGRLPSADEVLSKLPAAPAGGQN